METRQIEVTIIQHKDSDLLLAYSGDLKGLYVHGRSDDELRQRLPGAIKELLEAEGLEVQSVEAIPEDLPAGFVGRSFVANAVLRAA